MRGLAKRLRLGFRSRPAPIVRPALRLRSGAIVRVARRVASHEGDVSGSIGQWRGRSEPGSLA